jgi:phosphoribosylformimino-5-aminoimidazole carboxamide ribotide isomerase
MIEIIPAIDLIEGKCVRLTQGDYGSKKVYDENPLEVARRFEDWGAKRLHVVDLDGAKAGRVINYKVLEKLSGGTSLVIDFGGGVKGDKDVEIAFGSGVSMVTGGSVAVKERELFLSWLSRYGSDRIILGADAREGRIAIGGWQETTQKEVIPFIAEYYGAGIRKVICTDIGRDGMLGGASVGLYEEIGKAVGVYVIASGGVGSMGDIKELEAAGVPAVIVGKAIYEGKIGERDLKRVYGGNCGIIAG